MLKDTEDKASLLNGTNWIMTEAELIRFIDGGEVEEEKSESSYNKIATTNGVKNWITSF